MDFYVAPFLKTTKKHEKNTKNINKTRKSVEIFSR